MNRVFGFKEVLVKVTEEKDVDFTNKSTSDEKAIVEAEVVEAGQECEFYKKGDKVLVHKSILLKKNHKYFDKDEYLLDFEKQIICKIED